jgi:hypothetical protein
MSLREWFTGKSRARIEESGVTSQPGSVPDTSPASEQRPLWMTDGMRAVLIEGYDDLEVVGESFYQENLWSLVGGWSSGRIRQDAQAVLVAEHGNQYDSNAISVWIAGYKVGHLGREDAVRLRPGLQVLQRRHDKVIALAGQIVGGGSNEGRKGMLGVFLSYNSVEFGIQSQAVLVGRNPSPGNLRTGLSQAVATDEADDTYDLAWLSTLPGEPEQRLQHLRGLLRNESDLISRHYVFAELEATLYALRETSSTILEEYDAACREHDLEMDRIVPALVEKFGVVPLLATYRQAAIRHQKAKAIEQALWWAERGIALYQDNAAKSEMLLDLHKRAGTYRARLDRSARGA